ncbi:hypothetical protein K9L97_01275 [Candidatus Woesearchaeota archaeon]|nr:hypothetical protein [Candidatus Woesearchaeota archaeon]
MNYEKLIELGFNKNEAKVYLSLMKFTSADANTIIKDTKFHKNIVYDNLSKLSDKGLVTHIIKEGRTVFQAADPNMLLELFVEEQKKLDSKKKKAQKVYDELKKIVRKEQEKQTAKIYTGKKGIRTFYKELIEIEKDYVVFGAPLHSVEIMGETFWKNFHLKSREKGMKMKMIMNKSIKHYANIPRGKDRQVRFFDRNFEPLTETNIQGERTAIMVWTQEPILFLIESKKVADSYRLYFKKMWKELKE